VRKVIYGLFVFDSSGNSIFQRFYGKLNLDRKLLLDFVGDFIKIMQNIDRSERIDSFSFENLKFVYSVSDDIVSVLCSDKGEDEVSLSEKIVKVQEEFAKLFEGKPEKGGKQKPRISKTSLREFEKKVDEILLPFLKMVIVGEGGVGKTSLLKLIMGEELDTSYIPTVGVDVKEFDTEIRNTKLVFWDFSGQPRFRKLWKPFLEGTDIVILVTDSTAKNLEETKTIYQLIKAEKPELDFILIANKQDLPDATHPRTIGKYIGLKAHGMVAINPTYRKKILKILKEKISEIKEAKSKQFQIPDIKV